MIFLVLYAFATTILPLGLILASSFFPILGLFDLSQFGIGNYLRVFSDPERAEGGGQYADADDRLQYGPAWSSAGLFAYVISRQLPRLRALVESVAMLPLIVPGLVLGLATLWAFIRIPGLYGTLYILALAYVALGLPLGLRAISDTLRQVGPELEQASRVHGGGLWVTIRRILVPLALPGMVSAWFMIAVILSRELASSVLLYRVWQRGDLREAARLLGRRRGNLVAVMGVMMLVVLTLLLLLERFYPQAARIVQTMIPDKTEADRRTAVDKLDIHFGAYRAVDQVSFTAERGQADNTLLWAERLREVDDSAIDCRPHRGTGRPHPHRRRYSYRPGAGR